MARQDPLSIARKYNIDLSNFGTGRYRSTSLTDPLQEEMDSVNNSIGNYQQRLEATGATTPEPNKALSLLMKTLQVLDAPRNALWSGFAAANKGETDLFTGFKEGLTGERSYTGTDLAKDLMGGTEPTTQAGKFGRGVTGFLLEMVGDPLNYVTLGAGSLAKGLLTGSAKELGQEGAEAMAKSLVRKLPTIDDALRHADDLLKGTSASTDDIAKAAEGFLRDEYAKVFNKNTVGENFDELIKQVADSPSTRDEAVKALLLDAGFDADKLKYIDDFSGIDNTILKDITGATDETIRGLDNLSTREGVRESLDKTFEQGLKPRMTDTMATGFQRADEVRLMNEKGFSVLGKNVRSKNEMMNMGKAAREKIQSLHPALDKGMNLVNDKFSSVFNPYHITGVSNADRKISKALKLVNKGQRAIADEKVVETARNFYKILDDAKINVDEEFPKMVKYLEGDKTVELTAEARKIADQMADEYRKMGLKEAQTGLVTETLKDAYFPHVQNLKNTQLNRQINLGGLTSNLRMNNLNRLQRKYSSDFATAQKQMLFKTANKKTRQEIFEEMDDFLRTTLGDSPWITPESIEADAVNLIDYTDPTVWDRLKKGGGVDDFFEPDPVQAYAVRALRSNKILADNEFLKDMSGQFGKKVTRNNAKELAGEGYEIVVPKSYFNLWRVDPNDVVGDANVGEFIQGVGARVQQEESEVVKTIKALLEGKQGQSLISMTGDQYEALAAYFPLDAYALPKGLKDSMNTMAGKQIDEGLATIGSMIDRFYNLWKPAVTGLRPDYHLRNAAGSTWMNMMDVGFKALDPKIYGQAKRLLKNADDDFLTLAGREIDMNELYEGLLESGSKSTQMRAGNQTMEKTIFEETRGIAKFDPKKPIRSTAEKAVEIGKAVGNTIEDEVRAVNYLANVEAALENGASLGQAIRDAGAHVREWHFDYTELSKAEKGLFKRIYPFYSWTRKNVPKQLEQFLDDPRAILGLERFKKNVEQSYGVSDENQPAWFRDSTPIPLGTDADGNMRYANLSLPSADLGNIDDPKALLLNSMSPLFKTPTELMVNQNFLTGAPIYSNDYEKTQKSLEYILNQTGVLRDAKNTLRGMDESGKAVSNETVGNLRVPLTKVYNEKEANLDAAYAYRRQLANLVQYLKSQGVDVPDVNDLNDDEVLQLMKRFSGTQ